MHECLRDMFTGTMFLLRTVKQAIVLSSSCLENYKLCLTSLINLFNLNLNNVYANLYVIHLYLIASFCDFYLCLSFCGVTDKDEGFLKKIRLLDIHIEVY